MKPCEQSVLRCEEGVGSEEMITDRGRIRFILRSEDRSRSALLYGTDTQFHLLLRTHGNGTLHMLSSLTLDSVAW